MMVSAKFGFITMLMAAGLLAACSDDERFQNDAPPVPNSPESSDSVEPSAIVRSDEEIGARAKVLIDMCIAEGASADVCACQIKAVEDALETENFLKLIDLAEAGDESAAQDMLEDIMLSNPQIAVKMSGDMLACAQN